ncbi:MAG: chitobiase/beta-hexosaminidase C-terminal domain-containing protein, partial [Spirochaetales bacterium]|nr:chitobiase/beta-hexosaminidase C-terminal domain-containing protein [Spirochaetales bacterium]
MENMKKSSFLGMLLCIAIVFSCTGAPEKDVVITGKRTLAIPTFTTENSKVEYGTVIKFNYSPNDAQLYYTTDGSDPDIDDDDSFYYDPSKGIKLTESCTIKARLYHSNYNPSPVVGKDFKLYISEPVITANQDVTEITTSDEITISHDSKMVKIYYTTDGSEPTEDMEEYEGPFTFNKAGIYVVKAIAVRGGIKSKTVIKSYTVMAGAYLDTLKVEANGKNYKNYLENFKKSESNYTINVPNEVTSVNIVATSESSNVGGGNGSYDLAEGETTSITIFVTSKKDSNKTNTYTVNIYRAPAKASDDATLSVLELHGPGLIAFDKTFAADVFEYTAKVDSTVSKVTLTFVTNHSKAVPDVTSGADYILDKDEKDLSVTVTAENGETTETYNVKVIKNPIKDDNANLKSLTVAGNAVPVSNDYMTFSTSESKVEVVAKAESENASVKIDGKSLTALEVNVPGIVSIEITAENGTVKNYTLELKEASPICLATLKTVTVNGEAVTVASGMTYTTSEKTSAAIAVTADKATSVSIDGQNGTSANVTISADGKTANKTISIVLTDANGVKNIYTLSLTYKAQITDKIVLHAYEYTT